MTNKKQKEYFGTGSIKEIDNILAMERPEKIFLVSGKNSYLSSGIKEKLAPLLAGYSLTHFNDFSVNPRLENVEEGIKQYREGNCDFVLAVGGGSVLDIAKSINILAAQRDKPLKYITKELPLAGRGRPFVAIPTTAGTGSEATHFAVVYIGKTKYSLAHKEFMLPDYALLDPSLTYDLPPPITASTGLDALCQAIESYWSIYSTDESKRQAREAIHLILPSLPTAVNNPSKYSRVAMMKAANLAGKAINITKTTASHAISYPFTSYFGVPHGHAVALTLGEVFVYNCGVEENDCLDPRGIDYARRTLQELLTMFGASSAENVNHQWQNLLDSIGLERKITKLGVKSEEDINLIIANGFNQERVKNNLRLLTKGELRKILKRIS